MECHYTNSMDEEFSRAFGNLREQMRPGRVTVIYGARRTGKTTLVNTWLETQEPSLRVLRATGDNVTVRELLGSQNLEILLDWSAGYDVIFVDEAQRIPGAGWALKLLVDSRPDLAIIVTGSSSFNLSGDLGEPLTGRQTPLKLYPLSIGELRSQYNDYELKQNLEDLLVYGMYPEVRTARSSEQKRFILNELMEAYLLKDIFELERIKKPKVLTNLLALIALQSGSEVSLNELSIMLGIDIKTVSRYLDLLEKCFVLYNLRALSRNLRNEINSKSKYYFFDTGLRNAVIRNFNPLSLRNDTDALWENFVIIERLKARNCGAAGEASLAEAYFWRTWEGREIDLVEEYGGKFHAYECKWSEKKPAKAPSVFMTAYPDSEFSAINPDSLFGFV